ncbi:MAG: hypothetical protein QOJ38_326 [Solirubrobacterales bacterium]|jgi:DNA-binding MarR family transcriptional regulator|nr:hypothetical protein [Solirubrobacterales bacterium]
MQASATAQAPDLTPAATAEPTPEARETATRLGALLRYVFLFDQGEHLRAIEESGLTMTQVKLLLLVRTGAEAPRPVSDLAESLGISVATVSRAVECLVRKRLVKRVEDEADRRVRRVAIAAKGEELANTLIAARVAGLEGFAATLSAAERRKLDSALGTLLEREQIAAAYAQIKAVTT